MDNNIISTYFDVSGHSPDRRLLAWRDRVGHIIDILPTAEALTKPFTGEITLYKVGEYAMSSCRSEALQMHRSIARISTDRVQAFAFHIFFRGGVTEFSAYGAERGRDVARGTILAVDLSQPVRMSRSECDVLTFFVPAGIVEQMVPYPESFHGRALADTTSLTRLIVRHARLLNTDLSKMGYDVARASIRHCVELILAALGKQAQLSGTARASARAVMFAQIKRYIDANIHSADLTPEHVVAALDLPRPTIYRLFQHEGGLGVYIRNLRLLRAADDLVRYPHQSIAELAYGFGFGSPSDFTRAFRRAYEMAPQEFRALALERLSARTNKFQLRPAAIAA